MNNPNDIKASQDLEKRLDEAIDKMRANMRQGRRIVAIRGLYKGLIRTESDDDDDEKEDDDDPKNA